MASCPHNNSNPAHQHATPALHATTAAAQAAGVIYKCVWFNVAGSLDIVDLAGNKETVVGGIGSNYPMENFGVVTGGGTTLTEGQFVCLSG
jgi:hypothetical protein